NKPIEQITDSVNESLSTSISTTTVCNYLHEVGYYSRIASRKPFVSEKNHQKHLKWCKERKNGTQNGIISFGVMNQDILCIKAMVGKG
ncbi:8615_t:CDS:1, partial [Entrophospora sp. SA101]